jgi:SAM-dependent methyltransferase/uncharacterized protein YbaR (Trm112 family)
MRDPLNSVLACPRDRAILRREGNRLLCEAGHTYPIFDDVPVLLLDDVEQTAWWASTSIERAKSQSVDHRPPLGQNVIDPHVQALVAATSGYLYKPLVNRLKSYPIPDIRVPAVTKAALFLDVGCNWGRWSVAAARKGYRVIGVDPSLDAVLAARRVARQLNLSCTFVVADARFLPFRPHSFDVAFSYSVIQHFSKANARAALYSISTVLKKEGLCLIQMPNRFGIRSFYHWAKRGFSKGKAFDVRYYTVRELEKLFTSVFGNAHSTVDGYFGLGVQPADVDLLPLRYQLIVRASEAFRKLSVRIPLIKYCADSVYLTSHNSESAVPRSNKCLNR